MSKVKVSSKQREIDKYLNDVCKKFLDQMDHKSIKATALKNCV